MPTQVDVPGHGVVEFPDSMQPDEIKATIKRKFYIEPALKASMDVTDRLFKVLTNPAAGEAAQEGREQDAFAKGIGQQEQPPRSGEERAARDRTIYQGQTGEAAGRAGLTEPLVKLPKLDGKSPTLQKVLTEEFGRPPTDNEAATVAAIVNQGIGFAEFAESPLGVLTAGFGALGKVAQKIIAGGFAAQMASEVPSKAREAGEKSVTGTVQEKAEANVGLAMNVILPGILAKHALTRAAKTAEPVAPITAAAVEAQATGASLPMPKGAAKPDQRLVSLIEEGVKRSDAEALIAGTKTIKEVVDANLGMVRPSRDFSQLAANPDAAFGHSDAMEEGYNNAMARIAQILDWQAPKTPQEPLGGIQTPSTAESPAVPPAALEPTPSWQITAASFTGLEGHTTTGKNHIEAAAAQNYDAPKVPTERHGPGYGYEIQNAQTGETRIVSRDQGLEIARASGQLLNEPEFGKLHSNEIWHAIPFEKRQRLKQMSLSDTDIASIESGKERVEDVVQRKFPEISEETKGLIESEITGVLEEKGKPNAIHPESAQLLRTVRDEPGQSEGQVPAEGSRTKDDEGRGQASPVKEIAGPDLSEGETEPDIEPPGDEAKRNLPTKPSLPKLSSGASKEERHAAFDKFYDETLPKYEQDLAAWEAAQPKNKGILFRQSHGMYYAITKDPQGGWRATTFAQLYRDDPRYAPWGHQRYDTRLQAVRENVGELADKLPEIITEDEIKAKRAQGEAEAKQQEPPKEPAAISTEQLPKVAKAAKEPRSVAQALSSTKRFNRETELGGPDILSWMNENMKMLSKTAARLKWGREKFRENKSLWDDAVPMQRAHHNLVFSEKGSTPDQVAQAAYAAGQLSEPSVNELHAAMDAASKKRANVFATERREEKFMAEEAKQHTDWLAATKEGERRISADQLKVGDMLEVDDQQVEVTHVDAEGTVTLKDGRKFGEQKLSEGQSIHVEKWDPSPESEAEFAPTEVAPEAQPIEEPKAAPSMPKVGAMEKSEDGVRTPKALTPAGKAGPRFKHELEAMPPAEIVKWWNALSPHEQRNALASGAGEVIQAAHEKAKAEATTPKEIALQTQREAGWDPKWPFVPADFYNKDFRQAIEKDPTLSAAEKDKMFAAAEKLLGGNIERKSPVQDFPRLGAMEKGTGDLLKGVEEEFALVGDKGTDAERVAAEKAKAEKTAQEAKAIEEKQQMELPKAKEREGLLQKQSRLYAGLGANLNDWLRTATKEQVLEKYRLASEMGPEIDEEIATRKNLGEDFKALNPVKYDVDHLRAVMEHKLMTDFKDEVKTEPAGAPPEAVQQRGKVRLKGTGPQTYSVVEHLPATDIEISNGEQPVRVKNDKTGAESVVLESQLQEVQERTAEQREASKGMSRKELDDELRRVGLDPSSFGNSKEKRAALKRAKAKGFTGPGAMGAQDPFDPAQKAQIEQLTEAMKGLKGRKVSLREKIKEAFDIGDRLSAAKDATSRAIAGLKNSGDYIVNQWKGENTLDDMLRAKGVLSGELETRGRRSRVFAKQVLKDIPAKDERAAITKWIDAGGSQQELLWGANHTKPEYRQAYIDAIHLTGDKLTAARQMQSYFEARLQEAIDAGVLEDGIEDYIHRIFEKDPEAAQRMNGYVQSGILSRNPALAKKRIFQMDWEAERLGYKVVQDFVPRIVDYESSLSRAIAAREFVRKMIGFTDKDGVKHKGMLAPDGRPVIDVAGMGTPIEGKDAQGQPTGVIEGHLINPSFKPGDTKNPLNERGDYQERPSYSALKKWKWATEDAAGRPIYVQGNVLVHPEFAGRVDALLKPSAIRYAENPKTRSVARAALTLSSTVKQTMLDFSGFHQVQEIVHGAEHGVMPWKIIKDIDFMDPNVDALMKGGVTLGGEYRMLMAEGLVGRSLSNLIPGVSTLMKTYHDYLFQDFIPRLKMSMALNAFERNKRRFSGEVSSGRMTLDEVAFRTASEANAAFGGLNYTMLERSRTAQDIARLTLIAPDFLEARTKFVAQAFKRGAGDMKTAAYWKKGGPLTGNEQRQALLIGAAFMYTVARIVNQLTDGHPHFEPENAFSVVYKGKAYGLRTVQGDVLHLIEQPIQFWMSRLNPVFGRTLLEAGTGRDYFGRKRSVPEQIWDAVSTVAPVSLRFGRERSIWESLANGVGITARRYNDADQAFKLAQKWKDKNGIQSKGEFVYDSDKDPLRPLKLALANGDEAGAVKEIKKLKGGKSKYNTDFSLNTYFNHYATMRFTGSEENDRKFIASLSADEKKTVEAAKQAKMGMRELYFKANAKTVPQKVDVDRSGADVPIPQFPQRIE